MAQERVERRLAAILAADVVGYSRLMGENEAGTLAALKDHQAQFIDPTIAEHQGRIVKLMGDGALVEFASVVAAVECAVARGRAGFPLHRMVLSGTSITLRATSAASIRIPMPSKNGRRLGVTKRGRTE